MEQITRLRSRAAEICGEKDCPVILTGDMNSRPDTETYHIFTETMRDALHCAHQCTAEANEATSPGLYACDDPNKTLHNGHRIDYIFLSPEKIDAVRYSMIHTATNLCPYGEYISDHNAVIAELKI